MDYLVAFAVIALGVTMVISGVSGTGNELFSAVTGRTVGPASTTAGTTSGSSLTTPSTAPSTGNVLVPQGSALAS